MSVRSGLDVWSAQGFPALKGLKVGAIVNPTSVDARFVHLADLLSKAEGVKLNGWQRVWLIASAVWIVPWIVAIAADHKNFAAWVGTGSDIAIAIAALIALLFGPPILLYSAGVLVRWITRESKQT